MAAPLRIVGILDERLGGIAGALGSVDVRVAPTPLAAAKLMTDLRPDVLVINGLEAWQCELVRRLRPDRRPGTVVVGPRPWCEADEWMEGSRMQEEALARVHIAHERGRARRATARRALVDPLTGLPNRRAVVVDLLAQARRARRQGGVVSLVLIDLDSFKAVNDLQGHAAGDALLRRVGVTLRHATRGSEVCGRIGGDEFAALIAGDREDATDAARRLQEALAGAGIAASVGSATWDRSRSLRDLYRAADACLRDEKRQRHSNPAGPGRKVPARPSSTRVRLPDRGRPREDAARTRAPWGAFGVES